MPIGPADQINPIGAALAGKAKGDSEGAFRRMLDAQQAHNHAESLRAMDEQPAFPFRSLMAKRQPGAYGWDTLRGIFGSQVPIV